jgi:small subunit ribosomal protein S2
MINNLEHENKEIENNIPQEKAPSLGKEFYNKDDDFLPEDNLELIKKILEDFMGLGCHFGHPKISPKAKKADYVLYKLNGCNIINLDKTIESLRNALKLIFNTVNKGEKILFLTTNEYLKDLFKEIALQCRAFFITVRYQPGTLTNSNHFFDKKRRLDSTKSNIDESLTKKEKKVLKNKMQNTENYFEGLVGFNETPKLIITIGGEKEYNSVIDEAQKMNIGIISLNDVNVDPVSGFNTITIPANIKSVESIRYILNLMSKVILRGYEEYISYNNKRMFKGDFKSELPTAKVTIKDLEEKMKDKILSKINNKNKEKKNLEATPVETATEDVVKTEINENK